MLFTSVLGAGMTLAASGVAQKVLSSKGKEGMASTLDVMTKGGALVYLSHFLYTFASTVYVMFL